jgi:anti-sigma B factor antagonist
LGLSINLVQNPDVWVAELSGDLDYGECAAFRMHIDRIIREAPPAVILDLTGIEYLDSSGLGLLLALSKEYGSQGGKLVLVINDTVDNILSLTRLNGIFATATDMAEARAMVPQYAE